MVYTFKTKTASVKIDAYSNVGYFCLAISNSGDTSPSNTLLFDRAAPVGMIGLTITVVVIVLSVVMTV